MHRFEDTITIDATPIAIWALFTDVDKVSRCVPGLQEVEVVVEDEAYRGYIVLEVGSRVQRIPMIVRWLEQVVGESGRLNIRSAFGQTVIDVISSVTLTPLNDSATSLAWQARVSLPQADAATEKMMLPMLTRLAEKAIETFFARARVQLEDAIIS